MTELVGDILYRKRGDTAPDVINVTDLAGAALDVTGFTFQMTINSEKRPTDVTNQVAQINGTITNAAGGVVEFIWTALDADQTPGSYYYDIEQVDQSGLVKTIAKQKYIIYQDITKTN